MFTFGSPKPLGLRNPPQTQAAPPGPPQSRLAGARPPTPRRGPGKCGACGGRTRAGAGAGASGSPRPTRVCMRVCVSVSRGGHGLRSPPRRPAAACPRARLCPRARPRPGVTAPGADWRLRPRGRPPRPPPAAAAVARRAQRTARPGTGWALLLGSERARNGQQEETRGRWRGRLDEAPSPGVRESQRRASVGTGGGGWEMAAAQNPSPQNTLTPECASCQIPLTQMPSPRNAFYSANALIPQVPSASNTLTFNGPCPCFQTSLHPFVSISLASQTPLSANSFTPKEHQPRSCPKTSALLTFYPPKSSYSQPPSMKEWV